MSSFVFNTYSYAKTLYSIEAYFSEQIPNAFQQMEKLRHSGYLAGYVRREALLAGAAPRLPDPVAEHPGQTLTEAGSRPAALIKVFLYRTRAACKAEDEACACSARQRFCPSLCASTVETLADQPIELATRCESTAIFQGIGAHTACAAHYEDAFEDLVCTAATACEETADDREQGIEELLAAALGDSEMVLFVFSSKGVQICAADRVLYKRKTDARYSLYTTDDPQATVRELCQPVPCASDSRTPEDICLQAVTRMEGDRALLLREHLQRLARLARAHAIDPGALEQVCACISTMDAPLPGAAALWGQDIALPWGFVPSDLVPEKPDQPSCLHISVARNGSVHLAVTGIRDEEPLSMDVARSCLDERDDRLQLDMTQALLPLDPVQERIAAGTLGEALAVSRFAHVLGCARGALLCQQGPAVFCLPAGERLRDSLVLDELVRRNLVREKLQSLAQVLACPVLMHLDSVHGLRRLEPVQWA